MKSPACKSLLGLSEQLFLGWEQKGVGGWLARHRMFAICTMLSSVNTAANERAAICSLVSAPRDGSRINREEKVLCARGVYAVQVPGLGLTPAPRIEPHPSSLSTKVNQCKGRRHQAKLGVVMGGYFALSFPGAKLSWLSPGPWVSCFSAAHGKLVLPSYGSGSCFFSVLLSFTGWGKYGRSVGLQHGKSSLLCRAPDGPSLPLSCPCPSSSLPPRSVSSNNLFPQAFPARIRDRRDDGHGPRFRCPDPRPLLPLPAPPGQHGLASLQRRGRGAGGPGGGRGHAPGAHCQCHLLQPGWGAVPPLRAAGGPCAAEGAQDGPAEHRVPAALSGAPGEQPGHACPAPPSYPCRAGPSPGPGVGAGSAAPGSQGGEQELEEADGHPAAPPASWPQQLLQGFAERQKMKRVEQMEQEVEELKEKLRETQQQLAAEREAEKLHREQEKERAHQREEEGRRDLERWKEEERTKLRAEMDGLRQLFLGELKDVASRSSAMEGKLQELQAREAAVSMLGTLQDDDSEEMRWQTPSRTEQERTAVQTKLLSANKPEVSRQVTKVLAAEESSEEDRAEDALGGRRRLLEALRRNPNLLKKFRPILEEALEEKLENMGVKRVVTGISTQTYQHLRAVVRLQQQQRAAKFPGLLHLRSELIQVVMKRVKQRKKPVIAAPRQLSIIPGTAVSTREKPVERRLVATTRRPAGGVSSSQP
nr:cilium assembly protein DZIP1L isoform X1 [Anser cygnoides]XP_047933329.1 cilium assembly protein DZIP1L isoform X1 [Anser cygnoides]XP_047933330.1 cilium assembly protein DZIP1L isoform X1 [Anser cygnoides]